jgi:hypothetical protein
MRNYKGMSKAAMKAKRPHAEISVQYAQPNFQIYTHNAPQLEKNVIALIFPPNHFSGCVFIHLFDTFG